MSAQPIVLRFSTPGNEEKAGPTESVRVKGLGPMQGKEVGLPYLPMGLYLGVEHGLWCFLLGQAGINAPCRLLSHLVKASRQGE